MGRKRKKNKIPLLDSMYPFHEESTWEITEEDDKIFLEAVDCLDNQESAIINQKFDFIKEKITIRRKKASYREQREEIKATLDLHGFRREAALARLDEFCRQSAKNGMRTVMVITGKGLHSPHRKNILREEVIQWFNSENGCRLVEFYRPGSREQGGQGVLILYLRLGVRS